MCLHDVQSKQYYLIFEKFVTDLHGLADHLKGKDIQLSTRITMCKQICAGVAYVHKMGFIFRTFLPNRIMIDYKMQPKIIGFETCKSTSAISSHIASPFSSPESVKFGTISIKSDVYTLCAMLKYVFTGSDAVQQSNVAGTVPEIVEQGLNIQPEERPYADIIHSTLQFVMSK